MGKRQEPTFERFMYFAFSHGSPRWAKLRRRPLSGLGGSAVALIVLNFFDRNAPPRTPNSIAARGKLVYSLEIDSRLRSRELSLCFFPQCRAMLH
jgi:hypothetical protein